MREQFARTELIFGREAMEKLGTSRVAIFGIGGVGGYAAEALVRSGIGAVDLIDNDVVCMTNINRQIYATLKTVGRYKTDVAAERIADINPDVKVRLHRLFYLPETADMLDMSDYDYVADAIDTVAGKITIVTRAALAGTPVISSMGAGNRMDPTAFEVADIYETSICPLAKVMRRELKRRGITKLKVVYSREIPVIPRDDHEESAEDISGKSPGIIPDRRRIPGSNSFAPPVAGLIMASEIIKDLIQSKTGSCS